MIKVELVDHWGDDEALAHQAWASTGKSEAERPQEDVHRVVKQIMDLGHDTPKRRLFMDFYLELPIMSERHMDKYQIGLQYQDLELSGVGTDFGRGLITQNELSGRYRTLPAEFLELPVDIEGIMFKVGLKHPRGQWREQLLLQKQQYQFVMSQAKSAKFNGHITDAEYKRLREVYRGILGTAFMTSMRWVLNLDALEHVLEQRLKPDAQVETRLVAQLMLKELQDKKVAPVAVAALVERLTKKGCSST